MDSLILWMATHVHFLFVVWMTGNQLVVSLYVQENYRFIGQNYFLAGISCTINLIMHEMY